MIAQASDILAEIVAFKKKETLERKSLFPVKLLESSVYFSARPVSMVSYLSRKDSQGIIAEFKRRSPSKGAINPHAQVERTSIGYMMAGASALSILTDSHFFGGQNGDLTTARSFNYCPILRKDFILDEYQVLEARSIGADVILLIAAILSKEECNSLARLAGSLGMEVLLEIHDKNELNHINGAINLVGVNNRDLKTFETDLHISEQLAPELPNELLKIAESGIRTPADVMRLRKAGYSGFLMGEQFMKHARPELACSDFIRDLKIA